MSVKEHGFSNFPMLGIVVTLLIFLAIFRFIQYNNSSKITAFPNPVTEKSEFVKDNDQVASNAAGKNYLGERLAGTSSLLLAFNNADYQTALNSDKLLVLYFYANWCPICKAEFPKMEEAFNNLTSDKVVGFRVNFNDDETDQDEKNLAREFGVAYQHTKVFIKNRERVLKSPESWEKDKYLLEINNYL